MKQFSKIKFEYFTSLVFIDFFRLIRNFIRTPNYRNIIRSNRKWQNVFEGDKVYILANGPSLNRLDLKQIEGEKVIVMNSFQNATWKDRVNIVAHCLGEPYCALAWREEDFIESIEGTKSKSYWLHYTSQNKIRNISKSKSLNYVFLPYESGIYFNKQICLHKPTLAYQTTAQLAIQVALYMGFKEIILLGFDHDWLASPEYSKHFYSNSKDSNDTIGEWNYLELINMLRRMWIIYYKLDSVSKNHNAKIYNSSSKTFLDVFEKRKM